ncbi:MAG: exodeoxyribonuclease V subunit beta [Rhodoferax sp.]
MSATAPSTLALDVLRMPLRGWQLIEASAGTGKTWTLAALVVRCVIERDLYPPQLLVMTFTDAATEELRGRIRERLAQAARFFARSVRDPQADAPDDFLRAVRDAQAPQRWPACATALDLAAQWMDEAAIYTLHGWAARMLKRYAFDSASLFEREHVPDSTALKIQAAQDYWRRWFYPLPDGALDLLAPALTTPEGLLAQIEERWTQADRAPQAMAALCQGAPDPQPVLQQWLQWRGQMSAMMQAARTHWTPALVQALREAQAARKLKRVAVHHLESRLAQMAAWVQGGDPPWKVFGYFAAPELVALGWAEAAQWPALGLIAKMLDWVAQEPPALKAVLAHAAHTVWMDYQQAKAHAAQFDFSDLLQQLHHACARSEGRLVRAIRQQYPVALVDEFQDTDPWQYGTLSMIYGPVAQDPAHALVLIGDPKQAIYGFRGADLATYLRARESVQAIHTLSGNWRSTPALVAAVNHIFEHAPAPFGTVPYTPVVACNPNIAPLVLSPGVHQSAVTVWHTPLHEPLSGGAYRSHMAEVFASQMVHLLQQGHAQPSQMAVLVRSGTEAAAIRLALAQRGVRSVYLSERDSVYASGQAQDLWYLLRAVANPADARLMRTALCSASWGLGAAELDTLLHDEAAWDVQVEQFLRWQQVWRTQGVLPMLVQVLHQSGMAQRLLALGVQADSGERQLTNWLHLGELLQAASAGLRTPAALIHFLENQMRQPGASGDVAQLRLESDAHLVQVITLHKSKGLQYPLVFMPFVSAFRAKDAAADATNDASEGDAPDTPTEHPLAEDVRLLYVGLTRAEQALWLGVAPIKGEPNAQGRSVSALGRVLGLGAGTDFATALAAWAQCPHIVLAPAPEPSAAVWRPAASAVAWRAPAQPQRRWLNPRWSASFSALTRDLPPALRQHLPSESNERQIDAALDALDLADAPDVIDAIDTTNLAQTPSARPPGAVGADTPLRQAIDALPAGSRYGSLLHEALQAQAQHDWPAAQALAPDTPMPAWLAALHMHAKPLALSPQALTGLPVWLHAILTQKLPLAQSDKAVEALELRALKPPQRWPEMAFMLTVEGLPSTQLDTWIAQAVWPQAQRAALDARQLHGLLTGFIDLVFEHQGRYWVLDYKSNRLPRYDTPTLQAAALQHRYEVQAVLYQLALHRLLRARLPHYDPARHLGGALLWFVRGVDQPGNGVLNVPVPTALLETLDTALRGAAVP